MTEPVAAAALPTDWRERLDRGLLRAPEHRLEYCRYGGVRAEPGSTELAALRSQLPAPLRAAAVLLPIVERAVPTLLLTVRAGHLRDHAGQISFPGGRLEARDTDPAAAALRETQEEIGVPASFVRPIGFLTDHLLRSGFRITPVVALLQPGFTLRPASEEVSEVFELPLGFALADANYRTRHRSVAQREVEIWELPYGMRQIWGATAGMLANLRDVMRVSG